MWITLLILLVAMGVGGGAYLYYHGPGTAAAQPAGAAAVPAQPDDAAVQAEVKRTLARSDSTRNADFDAKVQDGVATLTGKTTRQNEADMAGALAAGVAGVKQVNNQIEVEKPPESPEATKVATKEAEPPARRQAPPPEDTKKRRARDLIKLGQSQVDGGDYATAVGTFQQALELDPSNSVAQAGLQKAQKAKQTEEDIMKRRR